MTPLQGRPLWPSGRSLDRIFLSAFRQTNGHIIMCLRGAGQARLGVVRDHGIIWPLPQCCLTVVCGHPHFHSSVPPLLCFRYLRTATGSPLQPHYAANIDNERNQREEYSLVDYADSVYRRNWYTMVYSAEVAGRYVTGGGYECGRGESEGALWGIRMCTGSQRRDTPWTANSHDGRRAWRRRRNVDR